MTEEKKDIKETINTTTDETGYINTEELRDILSKENENKKLPWYKRIFKKKNK